MKTLHDCDPVDSTYFETAPVRGVAEITISASPAQVFACLLDGAAWPRWVPVITGVEWTSPEPFEVGTTRTVDMRGGLSAEEYFFAWEHGARMAFHFVRTSMPVDAFAEDYRLEAVPGEKTRLVWAMAMAPRGSSKLMMKLTSPLLSIFNRLLLGRLKRLVEREYR